MIRAYKYVPAEAHDAEPQWVFLGELPDEESLAQWGAGRYRIEMPTKAVVTEGPQAVNATPKGWSWDRDVELEVPPPPKAKVKPVKS